MNKSVFLKSVLTFSFAAFFAAVYSQKKPIDHTVYNNWNSIGTTQLSESGKWVSYVISPLEGDGHLYLSKTNGEFVKAFERGKSAHLNLNESFFAFLIEPEADTVRKLKLAKAKKTDFPNDSLGIYWINEDSLAKFPHITSFKATEKGDWIAYLNEKDLRKKWSEKENKKNKKKGIKWIETSGTTLTVLNPINNRLHCIHQVKDYTFTKDNNFLAYTISEKGDKDSLSLFILNLADFSSTQLINNQFAIERLRFDHEGQQLAFVHSSDTSENKNYSLSYWKKGDSRSSLLADSTTAGMPNKRTVSKYMTPYFSRNGEQLFFGTSLIQYPEPKDTLLEIEKTRVDVWSGTDIHIQPEQLKNLKKEIEEYFLAVYHLAEQNMVPLGDALTEHVRSYDHGNSDFGLAIDNKTHARERTWEFPWRSNYYKVDFKTGNKTLLKSDLLHVGSLAPSGEHFIWYNGQDSSWVSLDVKSGAEKMLSSTIKTSFAQINNGMPFLAYPETTSGWMLINDQEYYIISDFYDLWLLNPNDPTKNISITNNEGRKNNIRFTLLRTETDSQYVSIENCVLKGMNHMTKDESIHTITFENNHFKTTKVHESAHRIYSFEKAKKSDIILMRRSSFIDYPNLESGDMTFTNLIQLTDANPQQSEYNWGTVEFVDWKAYDSTELRGLLYKPEDFDQTKKYPMIVYFYEDYQDTYNNYYSPRPTASIIYPTEYASNGYIVFIPDVAYTEGHPAKSAFNCIVSGTDYLVNKYSWIDSTKLGLQGQSWGGYQTAQLITMTNKYAAAMAGAPVSNMFSAYGGVRWGSGLSRMFQYERTQSRIGYTIWERPDLYIENSPLFGIPNITTPLLMMANDQDGAVPWYQGIEMYMGMRRLDKTVWLLNYNDDDHNLTRLANKRDLSIRMRQFFDYYLKDEPIPSWMKNGVQAIDKGKNNGYNLEK